MPLIFNIICGIFKRVLPTKIAQRFSTTSGPGVKDPDLDESCLPVSCGGTDETDVAEFLEDLKTKAPQIEQKYSYLVEWTKSV